MIKFKIISGYYQNITYEFEKEYDFTNLKKYEVELYKVEEPLKEINFFDKIKAKYIGISLVDRNPIFIITKNLIRETKIETLLK